jgi:CRISPR/Cas system-associated exonuclease Cas4 (RecB family)
MTIDNVAEAALQQPSSRNISNSEVTTWLTCRMQYYFAFMLNLTPKVTPTPLARGTLGHEAFSVYILKRLEGANHERAMKLIEPVWTTAMQNGMKLDTVLETKMLWERYMHFHQGWPEWELLGTEERVDLPITATLTFPIRYDLMVREIASGKRLVGDFKFTYDFWQSHEHDLNVQLPKYITVLNTNGYNVDGGFLEEIRTRPLGKDKAGDPKNTWRRTKYFPSPARKRNTIKQHIAASLEIEDYRNLNEAEREAVTIPVFSKHGACKYCNFTDLCNSALDGKTDLTFDIEAGYVQNTYGYNKQQMDLETII